MLDVVALGEILIDFTPKDNHNNNRELYEVNPGGAPANVLVALSKFNKKTGFIGKIGNDHFGNYLENVLVENKISTQGLVKSNQYNTTLAFVHLDNGERSFSFYRKPSADMMLKSSEVSTELIKQSKIFHFGSLSLTNEENSKATFKALKVAKENGIIVSYDPNLRISLWENLDQAKSQIIKGLEYTNILKISIEELVFITGDKDLENATNLLRDQYQIPLILVTLGSKGSYYKKGTISASIESISVNAIDTTGAGDAFMGTVLAQLIEKGKGINDLNRKDLDEVLLKGNIAGALTTTGKGAIASIPTNKEIVNFYDDFKKTK